MTDPIPCAKPSPEDPQWLLDLRKDGRAVVTGVIPRDRADAYADQMFAWAEGWKLGYKRNDPRTYKTQNLHAFIKGGMTSLYGAAHEQFAWDIRQEQAIIDVFAKIWGTDELVVSFDGINISVPLRDCRETDPWPHTDQSPLKPDLQCVQGIVNLLPNGPNDGGLCLLKGSSALFSELFEAFDSEKPPGGWNTNDIHMFNDRQMQWLHDRGCRWEKVCAEPGDLLLWDSRTAHYGMAPTSNAHRLATYVCYKPASLLTPSALNTRLEAWKEKTTTTHDPISLLPRARIPHPTHPTFNEARARPLQNPVLTPRGRQLVGLDSY